MEIKKSTHESLRTELFMPVMKGKDGTYRAVLSDNSTDRDDERVSKSCLDKLGRDGEYLAALCNHKNDVFMQVAEWTNKGCREIDGNTALVAEPKFYLSNPNAVIIKGMLDEGAKIGISIGAIVHKYEKDEFGNKIYTDLELVEASFVAVPSNRHGRAMAVAKSFNKNVEDIKVEKEFTQKDIDSAVEKKVNEVKDEFNKQLEEKVAELKEMTEKLEKAEKMAEEAESQKEEAESQKEEAEQKESAAKTELEKVKKEALDKQKFANQGGDIEKASEEDVEKAFQDGKLPVMRME